MQTPEPVQTSRIIPAPAGAIFELLAHPAQHALIDGSGTVKGAQLKTPERLSAGARFGMEMDWGVKYKILNTVVEFEEGRRIAWRHFGGHVWRYVLEPVDDLRTNVTEQFDTSGSRSPFFLRLIRADARNYRSMVATLERLDQWARSRTAG